MDSCGRSSFTLSSQGSLHRPRGSVFALESRKWQRRAAAVASGVTERNPSVRGTTVTTATRAARYGLAHLLFRELTRGRSAHFLLNERPETCASLRVARAVSWGAELVRRDNAPHHDPPRARTRSQSFAILRALVFTHTCTFFKLDLEVTCSQFLTSMIFLHFTKVLL